MASAGEIVASPDVAQVELKITLPVAAVRAADASTKFTLSVEEPPTLITDEDNSISLSAKSEPVPEPILNSAVVPPATNGFCPSPPQACNMTRPHTPMLFNKKFMGSNLVANGAYKYSI
jgi:hypothetical protein